MQKQSIRPYFHYPCKPQTIILDSQYTFQGNLLAICTSSGCIYIYRSPTQLATLQQQQNKYVAQYQNINKDNCFIKLAWSFYNSSILAALAINGDISCFQFDCEREVLKLVNKVSSDCIPVFASFYPSFQECVLSVGFSDGRITIYNENLQELSKVQAHSQSVNWLSWQRRLGNSQRNKWIYEHFPNHVNTQTINNPALLASGSSDQCIKIWNIVKGEEMEIEEFGESVNGSDRKLNKLELIHTFRAHLKEIRQVMWKPNYFINQKIRNIVSCSQDGFVKFWEITETKNNKLKQKMQSQRNFNGPVFRSEYNSLGTLIAISYYGGEQGKVETKAFVDRNGILGEQVPIVQ